MIGRDMDPVTIGEILFSIDDKNDHDSIVDAIPFSWEQDDRWRYVVADKDSNGYDVREKADGNR